MKMKKVITLRSAILHILHSIMVCKSTIVYDPSVLSYAINHLQEYNRVNVRDVVVLCSSNFYYEENNIIKDIYDIASQNETYFRFSSSFMMERNMTQVMKNIKKLGVLSVLILPDFENSEDAHKTFLDLPVALTRERFWILLLSSNYSNYDMMSKDVNQLLPRHPDYHSKFLLDSQVYFLARINGMAQLFEIYQICKNWKPTIKYLVTVTNNQPSLVYIWENRRNLGQCKLRVGYLEFAREVIKLSNVTSNEANKMTKALQSKRMMIRTQELVLAGYSVQRFKILQENLNFSIKLLHVDDQKVGSFDSEANQWSGIVGMLMENEIDTSLIEMTITEERKYAVAFATPSQFYTHYLYSLKPGPSVSWSHSCKQCYDTTMNNDVYRCSGINLCNKKSYSIKCLTYLFMRVITNAVKTYENCSIQIYLVIKHLPKYL